jgi:hypothetical protein
MKDKRKIKRDKNIICILDKYYTFCSFYALITNVIYFYEINDVLYIKNK